MSTRPRRLRTVAPIGPTPAIGPAVAEFRIAVGPGRMVDLRVPPDMTHEELLILVGSIAGGMRAQLTSKLVVPARRT